MASDPINHPARETMTVQASPAKPAETGPGFGRVARIIGRKTN